MTQFRTTAAYVSGAICGNIWQRGFGVCGMPHQFDVRRRIARFSDPRGIDFRTILLHELMECGGDFRNARFSSDTVLRIERRAIDGPGKYRIHVRQRPISELRDCDDLVHADTFAGDFSGDA